MKKNLQNLIKFDAVQIATLVVIVLMSVAVVRFVPVLHVAESFLYDFRLTLLSSPKQQSKAIVVVGITEQTLSAMPYRSPVDRAFLSQLIKDLEQKGARAIAFDILFDQPTEAAKDQLLARTLAFAKIPIIVASANSENGLLPAQSEYLKSFTESLVTGNATIYRNSLDGVIRTFPLRVTDNAGTEFGFAAQIARTTGYSLPDSKTLNIDYYSGPDSKVLRFPVYPAHTVGYLPRDWIEDKIVLVGADLALEDRHATPFSRVLAHGKAVAGVLIHAQALSQLMESSKLVVAHLVWTFVATIIFAVFGLAIASTKLRIRAQCFLVLGFMACFWLIACLFFAYGRIMIEIIPTSIALILSSLVAILRQWKLETENRLFIQSAFSKYLSPSYVDQLVENPDLLQVGGERREMTFLFTDLAGFTPLTESLEPSVLVSLLNEYLDGSCEIVTRHGGMVASIIGDALYVIFNAPVYQDDHAQKAVNAALELDSFCMKFKARKCAQGIPLDITRIGINTGPGVIGNYGGNQRLEYTAMGDGINTAARLESLNKHLGTRICVSESTVSRCSGVIFRPVGRIVLKGKSEGIGTFEPLGLEATDSADFKSYNIAYKMMVDGAPDALAEFQKLSRKYPVDPLLSFHMKRLQNGKMGELIVMEEK